MTTFRQRNPGRYDARRIDQTPFVPAGPLRAYVRQKLLTSTKAELAQLVGITERRIHSLVTEDQPSVRLDTADKILTNLDGPQMLNELYPYDQPLQLSPWIRSGGGFTKS
jgi:hypothetical protein